MDQKLKEQMCEKIIGPPTTLGSFVSCFYSLAILSVAIGVGMTTLNEFSEEIK